MLVDDTEAGTIVSKTFWLTGRALAISKHQLDTLGFEGLPPSEIETFRHFETLPTVRAFGGYREYQGRQLVDVRFIEPDSADEVRS